MLRRLLTRRGAAERLVALRDQVGDDIQYRPGGSFLPTKVPGQLQFKSSSYKVEYGDRQFYRYDIKNDGFAVTRIRFDGCHLSPLGHPGQPTVPCRT